jgi:hypothetical protein
MLFGTIPCRFSRIKGKRSDADSERVSAALGIRFRFLIVIAILSVAAIAAGLLVFTRLRASHDESANPVVPAAPGAGPTATNATAPHRPSTTGPVSPADPTAAAPGLPAAVARELAAKHVVVVSLFAPKAKVDATAMREAAAGAALAGAAFVSVDVTKNEIDGLNRRYGVIQDPAVLVLRPPGDLIVRIDGFADRDTVAQAAANASS